MHDTLTEIEMHLRTAERQVASARLKLAALKRVCTRCGEPLDSIEEGLCAFCDKVGAAIDGEVTDAAPETAPTRQIAP